MKGSRKLAEVELFFAECLLAEFNKMFVVCEQEDLGSFGEAGKLRKNRLGPLIVECDQQIIQNERHRLMFLQVAIQCRKTKGEVKLIS